MKKTFCYVTCYVTTLAGIFCASSAFAFSIEKYNDNVEDRFIVTPPRFEFKVYHGQTSFREFTVVNRLGKEKKFEVVIEGLVQEEEEGKKYSAVDWIEPEVKDFTLAHGERMRQKMKIQVPENMPSGGYYATLLVRTEGEDVNSSQKIRVINQVGVPVLTTMPGKVKEELKIKDLSTDLPFYLTGPVTFSALFKNTGDIHLSPRGSLEVRNFLGAKVAEIPIEKLTVLPNTEKKWQARWLKKWLIGKYDVKLTAQYGAGSEKIVEKTFFWAFPIHILLLVVAILFVIYYVAKKLSKKFGLEIKRKK
ncbi:MAG: hypothetical protein U5L10_05210 [Candidatus Moranbacteria bacterium]|nr:hypothetical protein [Candidatus Moranbacteria bacterium]